MIKLYRFDELRPEEILNRDIRAEKNVEDVVDGILADVRARGDAALKEYALKFDGASIEELQVTQAEIDEAFANMDPYFLETLKEAAANIEAFHRQQVHKNFVMNDKPGVVLGQKYTPIEKAGVYVPGGTAAYPSTVLMDVIPAKVAGVSEIIMTTPAGKDGSRFGFGKVERPPVHLGVAGDQINHESDHGRDVPLEDEPAVGLSGDDLGELHRIGQYDDREDRESDRKLI